MGSVNRVANGWRARWRDQAGRSRSKTFTRKVDAERHLVATENDKASGGYVDPARGRLRVDEWHARWWPTAMGRPSSLARDDSYARTHLLPRFGGYRLVDVTRGEVQAWVHDLEKRLAPASIHKAVQVLSKMLEAAVRDGRLATNPCRRVELPKIEDDEARFLTPDELLALEEAMLPHWRDLIPFLADTGLRIGEAAALRWPDIDTWGGTVRVREVLVEVRGTIQLGPPKTRAGRRTVPTLTREVGERLSERSRTPEEFVFAAPGGGPMRPNNFRRGWRKAARSAEIAEPLPTPHTLRHTAVAHWIAAGVDPYRLAKWAGHRSVATIYRVYGHLLDTDAVAEREALSAIRAAARERRARPADVITLKTP